MTQTAIVPMSDTYPSDMEALLAVPTIELVQRISAAGIKSPCWHIRDHGPFNVVDVPVHCDPDGRYTYVRGMRAAAETVCSSCAMRLFTFMEELGRTPQYLPLDYLDLVCDTTYEMASRLFSNPILTPVQVDRCLRRTAVSYFGHDCHGGNCYCRKASARILPVLQTARVTIPTLRALLVYPDPQIQAEAQLRLDDAEE